MSNVVVRSLGLFLGVAALFKLHGLGLGTPSAGFFEDPVVQIFAIAVELQLGVVILCRSDLTVSWTSAVLVFCVFTGVSSYQLYRGFATCGCLGQVHVYPGTILMVDLTILGALVAVSPFVYRGKRLGAALLAGGWQSARYACIFAISGLSLALTAQFVLGSGPATLAFLRNDPIILSPTQLDIGTGKRTEIVMASMEVTNRRSHRVRLYGGSCDCLCSSLVDLPLDLEPGQTATIRIRIKRTGALGQFHKTERLYVDDAGLTAVPFYFTGFSNE